MATSTLPTGMIEELTSILGEGSVLVDVPARINRTRLPAPFPVHDWAAHVPQAVVLPETTEQVAAVVRLANTHGVGIIPRAGATGLADGAMPMRGGIVVDIKRMDKVLEIDEGTRTVTVQTGIGLEVLNNRLKPLGFTYPDDPSSFPSALVGGRIGTGGWSHLAGRFGHTRDLVISMTVVLPTGEVVQVGDGGGAGIRKSSTGYQMKGLFFGHQGTLGIATEATLELIQRPEAEFTPLFAAADFETGYRAVGALTRSGLATLSGVMFTDDSRIDFARREGAFAGEPDVGVVVHAMLLGSRVEVAAAGRVVMDIAAREGLRHLGDEESQHEWAARHLPHLAPLHGRLADGQVVPMTWHVQDAACPYPNVPQLRARWREIIERYKATSGIIDNWGMTFYTNGAFKPWADLASTIEVGIWEQAFDATTWQSWVDCELELGRASVELGGSISNAHGACRAGSEPLVAGELGSAWPLMKLMKRTLDPNNIMNPGKYGLDEAYENGDR